MEEEEQEITISFEELKALILENYGGELKRSNPQLLDVVRVDVFYSKFPGGDSITIYMD